MLRSVPRWADLGSAVAAVEQWILPGECLLCHGAVGGFFADSLICGPCRNRWTPLPLPICTRCGQPLTPGIACRTCIAWPDALSGVSSVFWLDAGARRAVHLLKYGGWWRVSEAMARGMHRLAAIPRGSTLVPIPLGPTRLRTRGYNQSAVLAAALGKLVQIPVADMVLQRRRETTSQTALTPEERRANLSGAFAAAGPVPLCPVLVDDVFTTGATLAEAAAALLAAGAATVGGITFARAPRPLADAAAALHLASDTSLGRRE
mgnify:CR=1 FL=1